MIDLISLSLPELCELERLIPREIRRRRAEERQKVRKEVEAFIRAKGYSMEDLQVGTVARKSSGAIAPKYRHPRLPNLTWTGRGRKPKWVETWLSEGGSISELEI